LAYAWSKTLTDADVAAGGGPAGQTYYNRGLEKAVSDTDVPQAVSISFLYDLPFGPGKRFFQHGALGKVMAGWTLTNIDQYWAGTPIVLTANNTLAAVQLHAAAERSFGCAARNELQQFQSGGGPLYQSGGVRGARVLHIRQRGAILRQLACTVEI